MTDYAEQLRKYNRAGQVQYEWFEEAATYIEKLEAERDEALNQLHSARRSISVLEKREKMFCDGWGIADKGRIEAEAKLAKAVDALDEVDFKYDMQNRGSLYSDSWGGWESAFEEAASAVRITLAELKGDSDE